MAVGTDHHLLAGLVEAVESVEKLLQDLLFALEELDIIEQEHIGRSIALFEVVDPLPSDGVDEVVQETLRRDVSDRQAGIQLEGQLPDGVEKVSLAEAG